MNTDTQTQTVFEQFLAEFDGDGQQWTTVDGRDWDDVAEAMGGRRDYDLERDYHYDTAYRFPDGSTVCAGGAGWDSHEGWREAAGSGHKEGAE